MTDISLADYGLLSGTLKADASTDTPFEAALRKVVTRALILEETFGRFRTGCKTGLDLIDAFGIMPGTEST